LADDAQAPDEVIGLHAQQAEAVMPERRHRFSVAAFFAMEKRPAIALPDDNSD
jgi:hypothetical protein